MDTIPSQFTKNGINHLFVLRMGDVALYRQEKSRKVFGFEIHKIRHIPERASKFKPQAHERLGSNEDFGTWAWSFKHYKNAIHKFKEVARENERDEKNKDTGRSI